MRATRTQSQVRGTHKENYDVGVDDHVDDTIMMISVTVVALVINKVEGEGGTRIRMVMMIVMMLALAPMLHVHHSNSRCFT